MNKVILIGNLTADPELTTTTSGISVCRFTLAVNRLYRSADGQQQTDFLPIVTWRGLADNCHRYLSKGKKAAISGSIQTRSYTTESGEKRYVTEINADEVEFLSARSSQEELEELPEVKKAAKVHTEDLDSLDTDLPF